MAICPACKDAANAAKDRLPSRENILKQNDVSTFALHEKAVNEALKDEIVTTALLNLFIVKNEKAQTLIGSYPKVEDGYAALPEPLQDLVAVQAFDADVANGGIIQFFFNNLEDKDKLPAILLRIGCQNLEKAYAKALKDVNSAYLVAQRNKSRGAKSHAEIWEAFAEV